MAIKPEDTAAMLYCGKRYSRPAATSMEKCSALEEAANLMLVISNDEERRRLLWWWTEGVRDYCESEQDILDMRNKLCRAMETYSGRGSVVYND